MVNAITLLIFTFNVSNTLTPLLHKEYPYSKGESSFGLKVKSEEEPIGPYSFAIGGPENNIYITDPVNGFIKVISATTGDIVQNIPFKGYYDDIRVDRQGMIYILDRTGQRIISLAEDGKTLEAINLEYNTVKYPCKLTLKDDNVYIKNMTQQKLINAKTKMPASSTYEVDIKGQRLDVFYLKNGNIKQIAGIKVDNIASAEFLGTDRAGNIYIQIEVKKPVTGVSLKVLRLKPSGKLTGDYTIPENDYFVWTARLLDIDGNGNIYQILPAKDHLEINVWKTE